MVSKVLLNGSKSASSQFEFEFLQMIFFFASKSVFEEDNTFLLHLFIFPDTAKYSVQRDSIFNKMGPKKKQQKKSECLKNSNSNEKNSVRKHPSNQGGPRRSNLSSPHHKHIDKKTQYYLIAHLTCSRCCHGGFSGIGSIIDEHLL